MSDEKSEMPCWVCGKMTTSVCGACASADKPMEISLCSRECQKLFRCVWPIYKVFCGPGKTNPFTLPPLSKEEGDEAKAQLHTHLPDEKGQLPSSLASSLAGKTLGKNDVEGVIDELQNPAPPGADKSYRQGLLAFVRFHEHRRTIQPKDGVLSYTPLAGAIRASSMSWMCADDVPEYGQPDFPAHDLFTERLHRLFFFHYTCALVDTTNPPRRADFLAFDYCREAVKGVAEAMKQDLPKEAASLVSLANPGIHEAVVPNNELHKYQFLPLL
ncbi:hypothetical protein JCM8547_001372 [Rhodosporidiobolus lusitaniae]